MSSVDPDSLAEHARLGDVMTFSSEIEGSDLVDRVDQAMRRLRGFRLLRQEDDNYRVISMTLRSPP